MTLLELSLVDKQEEIEIHKAWLARNLARFDKYQVANVEKDILLMEEQAEVIKQKIAGTA